MASKVNEVKIQSYEPMTFDEVIKTIPIDMGGTMPPTIKTAASDTTVKSDTPVIIDGDDYVYNIGGGYVGRIHISQSANKEVRLTIPAITVGTLSSRQNRSTDRKYNILCTLPYELIPETTRSFILPAYTISNIDRSVRLTIDTE